MIRDGVELHNVASVEERDGGVLLERVPPEVRERLNEKARGNYTRPTGVEIRFVADGPVRITLSCPTGEAEATPFWGPFRTAPDEQVSVGSERTTVELSFPDRLADVDPSVLDGSYFAPEVGRLVLRGRPTVLHGVEGDVRPPRTEELPDLRYLAYGTSITQGAVASNHALSYVARTARRLGADLLNFGTGGSAFCEPELTEYFAERDDWDVATLAISVNMIAVGFTAEEFRERASYMIDTVGATGRPVAAITLFPVFPDLGSDLVAGDEWAATPQEYREVLRDVVTECPHENVHLFEGPDLLSDVAGLSPDLVHPTDEGMIDVGERLAPRLEALLDG